MVLSKFQNSNFLDSIGIKFESDQSPRKNASASTRTRTGSDGACDLTGSCFAAGLGAVTGTATALGTYEASLMLASERARYADLDIFGVKDNMSHTQLITRKLSDKGSNLHFLLSEFSIDLIPSVFTSRSQIDRIGILSVMPEFSPYLSYPTYRFRLKGFLLQTGRGYHSNNKFYYTYLMRISKIVINDKKSSLIFSNFEKFNLFVRTSCGLAHSKILQSRELFLNLATLSIDNQFLMSTWDVVNRRYVTEIDSVYLLN